MVPGDLLQTRLGRALQRGNLCDQASVLRILVCERGERRLRMCHFLGVQVPCFGYRREQIRRRRIHSHAIVASKRYLGSKIGFIQLCDGDRFFSKPGHDEGRVARHQQRCG